MSAIKALGELGSSLAIEPVIEALRRNSWDYAAEGDEPLYASLLKFGEPMFIRLVDLLKDEDQEMRFWAIHALGYSADTRAIEPLIEVFSNETESFLKRAVVKSIFLIGDKRAAPVLINALRHETNPVILSSIFHLLNEMTSEYVIECLLEVIRKAENEEKSRVIDAALEYSKPEVSTAISSYVDANKQSRTLG